MSRQDREAWQAELDADPALKAAWNGFIVQLDQAAAVMGKLVPSDDETVEAATRGLVKLRAAAQRIYAAAGLAPEDEGNDDD